MRGTPARRIASTTVLVSAVPSRKSTVGSRIAAAMSGLEARWMTTPWPAMAALSASKSPTSPRTTASRRSPAWAAKCQSRPEEKLS